MVTFLLRYIPALKEGLFVSTVIIMGLVLSIVINVIINLIYLIITFVDKPIINYVPRWLVVINFLFFVVQAILLLK
ncbi:MAG TPA: hypothetical protein VM101_10145 [Flavitalea sp.]|nr:hypothetical protein [Flavitalea sp.]